LLFFWLSFAFAQGDPYSTKCARNGTSTSNGDALTCDDAAASNGAKNNLYKPDGYKFAIDIGASIVSCAGSTQTRYATAATFAGGRADTCVALTCAASASANWRMRARSQA